MVAPAHEQVGHVNGTRHARYTRSVLHSIEHFLNIWYGPSLFVGIVALIVGGNLLVDGSVVLARRLGLSTLLIGLTVVAFGTSAPELAFNIIAAIGDHSALSFGNIVGSNIANIGLVLGLAAIMAPLAVHSSIVKRELPITIVVSVGMIAMFFLPPHDTTADGSRLHSLMRTDALILLGGFGVFMWLMLRMARSDRVESARVRSAASVAEVHERTILNGIVRVAAGLALLLGGGKMAELGAIGLSQRLEISDVIVALVVIAIATSLPEVATSIIAARRGHADLAVGNIMGSNIFNILLVMGVTATVNPVDLPDDGSNDLAVMLGILLALGALVLLGGRVLRRGGGAALLLIYASYLLLRVLQAFGVIDIPQIHWHMNGP